MRTRIGSGSDFMKCINADALVHIGQAPGSNLFNFLAKKLQAAAWAVSRGQWSPEKEEDLDNLITVIGYTGFYVWLEATDIFGCVDDLDTAVEGGLMLLPGFDRPVLRINFERVVDHQEVDDLI
ncbi:hypothetical protein FBY14_13311 [Azospirillum brasilense]|nr:hypothetical protein FBY14_13311 [Azospirillum brasilense]